MLENQPALIVTAMKNEGPYIIDWVAHHMAVGFDSFMVVTNDCNDHTDRILDRLEKLINLKHVANPKSLFPEKTNWQVMAVRYATLFTIYKDAGWIYFTDVDEFLQVWTGDGTLQALHDAAGGFDVVSFTSMPFGSSGVSRIEDLPATRQFTVQSKDYEHAAETGKRLSNAIKTMFHNKIKFSVRRNHRPRRHDFSDTGYRWIDGSGRVFSDDWVNGKAKAVEPIGSNDLAQFNHYAIRSEDGYLMKVSRGDVVGAPRLDDERAVRYWRDYNAPGTVDTRAVAGHPKYAEIRAELMSDPTLREWHEASLAFHRDSAAKLRERDDFAQLLERMAEAPAEP
ncbi:glycosyltransferase family 2 protein [Gymnodinialimonas ceratoperidinii]|uniref:Glycosyltransferase family 2 protein n=1 Tax=Gymnodinialimonas ceratoperidinii TaxID=2856823 RepID=A0A8F6U003_9RHOB|nr:glycosyltransferase family 2 protein [Gymnodinialimonas ceratoperidinii]QXT40831.1 glycosyltransferase family 2 protein [Gymnodinialimonas ceratoperidinii]